MFNCFIIQVMRIGFAFIPVFALIFFMAAQCIAQTADTIKLKTVDINESRVSLFNAGNKITTIDSATLSNSLHTNIGELLSNSSTVFIKTYGSGGSATLSSRGTEARHSSILWNGFNINSASLGLTDLSLIPVPVEGSVRMLHGGSGAVNGNSSLGSTVMFEAASPKFVKAASLFNAMEFGSFGNKHISVAAHFGSKKWESRTHLFSNNAKNNFEYVNIATRDKKEQTQEHAAFKSYGILQDFHFKIKKNQILTAGIWYQITEREIPAMMTVPKSFAEQRDSNLRVFLGYKIIYNKASVELKGATFREFQFYTDTQQNLDLAYHVDNYMGENEWRFHISDQLLVSTGITYTYSTASFKEYQSAKHLAHGSAYAHCFIQPFRGWKMNLSLRQELASVKNPPLSPSLGVEGNLLKHWIVFKGNFGRHYNLPSMNDLYWVPGGNSKLKPEDAWSGEAGFIVMNQMNKLPEISFTAFASVVDNWIKWQPASGGIYTPDNLRQVKTNGFETSFSYSMKIKTISISTVAQYTFCNSYLSESNDAYSDKLIRNQLIYIPKNMANLLFKLRWKTFGLFYSHTFTGERFTTNDNTQVLSEFSVANIAFEKNILLKKSSFNIHLKINNLYNESYQIIAFRPTPGRWISGGIKLNFNLL